jgi:hypothetical protein
VSPRDIFIPLCHIATKRKHKTLEVKTSRHESRMNGYEKGPIRKLEMKNTVLEVKTK